MVDEDLELERDVGEATIVYDHPDEGVAEETVPNEHLAYFQDHWILKTDTDEEGNDVIRRIPATRVHHVERSVEAFEDEVATLRDQVQSLAADIRTKIPVGSTGEKRGQREEEVHRIDIDAGEPAKRER